jgi:glycosyltransferase involved in cell wall biosynthesis
VTCSTSAPMGESSSGRVIRVLAIIEGTKVNGPAKNLLEFCRVSRSLDARPVIATAIATFVRVGRGSPNPTAGSNELLAAAEAAGLEAHSIPERFPFDPQVVSGLHELVRRLDPDIIQTHHIKSHFLVRLSGLGRRYRWISFHHGYTSEGMRMRLYDQLDRWSLRAPAQIVTVCEPFKRQLVSRGVPASRIAVLHNAISVDSRTERGPMDATASTAGRNISKNGRGHERLVLAVGRLSREKGFPDLIAAMDRLRRLRRDLFVRLLIVGDGSEKDRIARAVQDLDLQDRITLAGHVQDVGPYYQRADVLAISSTSEGSPNVLLEGMAAGVPVVATSVGGIPEMVADKKSALLVEPSDPEAMASAINLLFSNSDLARTLSSNALDLIRTRHSPRDRARFLVELYDRIAHPQPA